MKRIYMDHAATTPLHPEVRSAMIACMDRFGNPSSVHAEGRDAKAIIHHARDQIASLAGCSTQELVFTSGGSESDNAAIWSVLRTQKARLLREGSTARPHLITTTMEHHAVLHAAQQAEMLGFDVTYVSPDTMGMISPSDIEAAIRPETCLISVMMINNEVGTIQPIEQIGRLAREHGIVMHTDAVQALGLLPLDLHSLPVDLASFSAHKINGPKGIGALYIRHGVEWEPFIYGGSQERKRRAGTENTIGIVGFGAASAIAQAELETKSKLLQSLTASLWQGLQRVFGEQVVRNGSEAHSAPHVLNVSFLEIPTETMLMNLDMLGIQVSSGSACTSGSLEISHVLEAMHLPSDRARTAVRFSLGLGNTIEQVQDVVRHLETISTRLRTRH